MRVVDPGHRYALRCLDTDGFLLKEESLQFVKREGEGYPGNVGHHSGTTTQEVLRALIDRTLYVDAQIPCGENLEVLDHLRHAIYFLEDRAAERHGRDPIPEEWIDHIETLPTCEKCNHVGCDGSCHP